MSKFVTDELVQHDLGDGDWVKVPKGISYEMMEPISGVSKSDQKGNALKALVLFIKRMEFER